MGFTTLSTLKSFIGIPTSDTINDEYLFDLINSVSASISNYIRVDIDYKTVTDYKFEGNNWQRITVPYMPINTLTALTIDDEDKLSEVSIENNRTLYRELGFPRIRYVEIGDVVSPNYSKKNIKATFTSGYIMPTDYTYVSCALSDGTPNYVVTTANPHGLATNDIIRFYGTLANNLTSYTNYYVLVLSPTTFNISLTENGTPITYLSGSTGITYKKVDTVRTLPYDIEFVCKKVCERLFNSKNRALNVSNYKGLTNETYNLNGEFFTDEEKYILNQYRAVI